LLFEVRCKKCDGAAAGAVAAGSTLYLLWIRGYLLSTPPATSPRTTSLFVYLVLVFGDKSLVAISQEKD